MSYYPVIKPHISPSALDAWHNSRNSFIKSYFEGDSFKGNAATRFGTVIHKMIEQGLLSAKKDYANKEQTISVPLGSGFSGGVVQALGIPDAYTLGGDVAYFVDYKTGKDDAWSAEKMASDLKMKFTAWLVLMENRRKGFNPVDVVSYIEFFQTEWSGKELRLIDQESELYEFSYTAKELDKFTKVVEKTVAEVNTYYTEWLESSSEFVNQDDVKEFARIESEIVALTTKQDEIKSRIASQIEIGGKSDYKSEFGTFYFTEKKKWLYPDEVDKLASEASAAKKKFETENDPVSISKSFGFRAKKA